MNLFRTARRQALVTLFTPEVIRTATPPLPNACDGTHQPVFTLKSGARPAGVTGTCSLADCPDKRAVLEADYAMRVIVAAPPERTETP